jgi:hypothetical protein
MLPPLFGKQEVGIWRVKKSFPRYGVPIWSLWPIIRSLLSIVAKTNAMKNVHICSMCHIEHICSFFVAFFSATIDGRNLIFGHKLHIGTPYCGKRFLTRQIPTSCLPKSGGIKDSSVTISLHNFVCEGIIKGYVGHNMRWTQGLPPTPNLLQSSLIWKFCHLIIIFCFISTDNFF